MKMNTARILCVSLAFGTIVGCMGFGGPVRPGGHSAAPGQVTTELRSVPAGAQVYGITLWEVLTALSREGFQSDESPAAQACIRRNAKHFGQTPNTVYAPWTQGQGKQSGQEFFFELEGYEPATASITWDDSTIAQIGTVQTVLVRLRKSGVPAGNDPPVNDDHTSAPAPKAADTPEAVQLSFPEDEPAPVPQWPPIAGRTIPDGLGDYYALVIGNNSYLHLPELRTAVNDAESVAELLRTKYGFSVEVLLNANRAQTLLAIGKLRKELKKSDNLLIYYAGHGCLDREGDIGYWLPIDATQDDEVNWIANSSITATVRAIEAKHVMVVSDSCYAGKLTRGVKITRRTPDYLQRMAAMRTRVVMTSGGLEPVADKGSGGEHSVFAEAFIGALQNNQTTMDATELFTQVRHPVMVNADQTPEYSDIRQAGHEGGDFLFVPVDGKAIKVDAAKAPVDNAAIQDAAEMNERGLNLMKEGKYAEAIRLYEEAAEMFERAGSLGGKSIALSNRAYCLRPDVNTDGDWGRAVMGHAAAYKLIEHIEDYGRAAIVVHHYAQCMEPTNNPNGDWDEAGKLYGEAVNFYAAAGNDAQLAAVLYMRATCLEPFNNQKNGNWLRAAALMGQAVKVFRRLGDKAGLARAIQAQTNDMDMAKQIDKTTRDRNYQEAIRLFKEAGDNKAAKDLEDFVGVVHMMDGQK